MRLLKLPTFIKLYFAFIKIIYTYQENNFGENETKHYNLIFNNLRFILLVKKH